MRKPKNHSIYLVFVGTIHPTCHWFENKRSANSWLKTNRKFHWNDAKDYYSKPIKYVRDY